MSCGRGHEMAMKLKGVMSTDVEVVGPEATLAEAAEKMRQLNVGILPVCDGDTLLGVLTDRDITSAWLPLEPTQPR